MNRSKPWRWFRVAWLSRTHRGSIRVFARCASEALRRTQQSQQSLSTPVAFPGVYVVRSLG